MGGEERLNPSPGGVAQGVWRRGLASTLHHRGEVTKRHPSCEREGKPSVLHVREQGQVVCHLKISVPRYSVLHVDVADPAVTEFS